ncbi:MAG: glutaredoxin family protein [Gallionellaceae bacterium]|nr:glutaredoxin family protein [Gallionellaceae bacterium]
MSFRVTIEFYGTEFCHLCDEAEAILREAGVAAHRYRQ